MWQSLRAQLGLIFLSFFILVGCSVAATFWLEMSQHDDATIINLAGRQRMLAQRMTQLALTQPDSLELTEAIQQFDQTLNALRDGRVLLDANGRFVTLPPTTSPVIQSQLDEAAQTWNAFRQYLQPPGDDSLLLIESNRLLNQLDQVVSSFEAQAQAKTIRLRQMQLAFLVTAFLLFGWGYLFTRRRILQPLATLSKAARRIGAGYLAQPVPVMRDDELGQLAQTLEAMRAEIAAAQELLEQRVAQRTHELSAAFEFSQEIVHQLDLAPLLQSVARRARDLMQGQAASVCILDGDGRILELVASSGAADSHVGLRQSAERGIALPVVQQGKTVITEGGCANCGFLHQFPGSPCITAPIRIGKQTLGALCVARPQPPFGGDESRALTLLANAAAIAIENARLVESSQQQANENAALAERERLAAELHDNLAQTLGAVNLKADHIQMLLQQKQDQAALTRLQELQMAVSTAYSQVRMVLTGLREPLLKGGGLAQRLQDCVAEFQEQSAITATFSIADPTVLNLPPIIQKQVIYIVREALINIRRHAQADYVQVLATRANGSAQFTIMDNGQGFDPAQVNSQNHLGLTIMQTRARRSGGQLAIHTTPNEGTQIIATFPLHHS